MALTIAETVTQVQQTMDEILDDLAELNVWAKAQLLIEYRPENIKRYGAEFRRRQRRIRGILVQMKALNKAAAAALAIEHTTTGSGLAYIKTRHALFNTIHRKARVAEIIKEFNEGEMCSARIRLIRAIKDNSPATGTEPDV